MDVKEIKRLKEEAELDISKSLAIRLSKLQDDLEGSIEISSVSIDYNHTHTFAEQYSKLIITGFEINTKI